MTNQNDTNKGTNNYFNGVLYTKAFINEVKIMQPKSNKAKAYCAINAAIVGRDAQGNNTYTTIDLIVKGQKAKEILWSFTDQWPANRFERNGERWIANINIGSISSDGYEKRDGTPGAVLKGRLINIRSLQIGETVVFGEIDENEQPTFTGPAYINMIDNNKCVGTASLLEGKVGEHDYRNINFSYEANSINVINKLDEKGLCPKGFKHRDTNAKIFANLMFSSIKAVPHKTKNGEFTSFMKGSLSSIKYISVNSVSWDIEVNTDAEVA